MIKEVRSQKSEVRSRFCNGDLSPALKTFRLQRQGFRLNFSDKGIFRGKFSLKCFGISIGLISLLSGCTLGKRPETPATLNSRYNDQQPALSGDGRWVALVSNRNGTNQILLYDLRAKQLVNLPGLNQSNVILESPSLSRTGRYLVYISSIQGRPDVALYDRATKRTELLTQSYRSWVRNPSISPDGRYIVFETARRGQWDIEVFDRGPLIELDIPDGTPVKALHHCGMISAFS